MAFQPIMTTKVEGISKLGDVRWRSWEGVIADVWSVSCAKDTQGEYLASYPRLFIMLEETDPGKIQFGTGSAREKPYTHDARRPMSFIPAGLPIRTQVLDIRKLKHLDLHLDVPALQRRFDYLIDPQQFEQPRLAVGDERLLSIARLIATECESCDTLGGLYGESLMTAFFVALFKIHSRPSQVGPGLSSRQLRRLMEFMEENCQRTIRLKELAEIAGLSEPYFCVAFKASTGMRPHEWQMNSRMTRVKQLLLKKDLPLMTIAAMTGFSDQAHLTRIFRRLVGTTPAAWRRERMC